MSKEDGWNYTDGDATRKSVYLPNEVWEKVDQYKDKKDLRSGNRAFNEIINTHLSECEKNNTIRDLDLPFICPRYNFENPIQPTSFIGRPAFCTIIYDSTYSTNHAGNNINLQQSNVPVLYLENIGNTSAKEVHLKIFDNHGKKLDDVDRFALSVGEWHKTRVDLSKTKSGKIKGTYEDVMSKKRTLDTVFHYPPIK